jgi:hypothetical protein
MSNVIKNILNVNTNINIHEHYKNNINNSGMLK